MGVEAHLGSDLAIGVREALADYTRRLNSDSLPWRFPRLAREAIPAQPARVLDLPVNEETWEAAGARGGPAGHYSRASWPPTRSWSTWPRSTA